MAFINIPDSDVDQDSPVTVALMTALRDNPVEIAIGGTNAPRIDDSALTTLATNTGRDWIVSRLNLIDFFGPGIIGLMHYRGATATIGQGTTVAGSLLSYADASGAPNVATENGTWQCIGFLGNTAISSERRTTVFRRIS